MKNFSWQVKGSLATSMFGAVVVGAIAILGIPESVRAATVVLGTDYWITQTGSSFELGGIPVQVQGEPIGMFNGRNVGDADTIVERKNNVTLSGSTPIEVVALSLKSVNPVSITGLGSFDVFVGLTPGEQSLGNLSINNNNSFSSNFTVSWTAELRPVGGGNAIPCPFGINGCKGDTNFTTAAPWSENFPMGTGIPKVEGLVGDLGANVHTNLSGDQTDFFPGVVNGKFFGIPHDSTGAQHHIVGLGPNAELLPVPEPASTALGSAVVLGFGTLFKRKMSKKGKPDREQ